MTNNISQMNEAEFNEWFAAQPDDMSLEDFDAAGEWIAAHPKESKPVTEAQVRDISPVALRRDANDQFRAWGDEKARKIYNEMSNADVRLEKANKWVASLTKKGYTEAQAQLIVFALLSFTYTAGSGNQWMANFTEKLHEQLVDKVSAFGVKAYPLTEKQFASAVKAAW